MPSCSGRTPWSADLRREMNRKGMISIRPCPLCFFVSRPGFALALADAGARTAGPRLKSLKCNEKMSSCSAHNRGSLRAEPLGVGWRNREELALLTEVGLDQTRCCKRLKECA